VGDETRLPGSSADLLERAARYDPAALGQIYDAYYKRIYGYIYRRTGDANVAEDLAADVFVRMLEAVKAQKGWRTSLTGWLYRIAHNLVIDYYRRQSLREGPPLDERLVGVLDAKKPSLESLLLQQRLRTAIQKLTEDQQQVIYLRFVEDLTNAEVADILGKTEGAVKALQHRALTTLRNVMKEEAP
jgi:RNA polymerase sigma-70 factor (ECF subfamily)